MLNEESPRAPAVSILQGASDSRYIGRITVFIRQLEYLVTLAREKHFAKAAEACHVSQPALSSAIRSFEKELGIMIVQRGRRFMGLTIEGERVLAWAQQTLASLAHMREDATLAKSTMTGTLRIGAITHHHDGRSLPDGAVPRGVPEYSLQRVVSQRGIHRQSVGSL